MRKPKTPKVGGIRKGSIPCRGGCGTKTVTHVLGSEMANLCYKNAKSRSPSLRAKQRTRKLDTAVRTQANNALGYHNAMMDIASKIIHATLTKVNGRMSLLHIRKQGENAADFEEIFEGGTDPMFNDAEKAFKDATSEFMSAPTEANNEKLEAAREGLYEAAELRHHRLLEQGGVKRGISSIDRERAVGEFCNSIYASTAWNRMSPEEKEAASKKAAAKEAKEQRAAERKAKKDDEDGGVIPSDPDEEDHSEESPIQPIDFESEVGNGTVDPSRSPMPDSDIPPRPKQAPKVSAAPADSDWDF